MDMSQGSNACQSHLGSGQESDEKKNNAHDHLKTFCCSAPMVQYASEPRFRLVPQKCQRALSDNMLYLSFCVGRFF